MFKKLSPARSMLFAAAFLAAATAGSEAGIGQGDLTLHFQNLPALDEGSEGHYEGWAVVNGAPVSTGKFNVDEDGFPVELGGGAVIDKFDAGVNISNATAIKITIEPAGDMDAIPSGLVIVGGDVSGQAADLKADVPGLATLESMTAGAFLLASPSDNAQDDTNDDQGIWFLTMPGPMAGFTDLPDLGVKWRYEGWVVDVSDPMNPVPYSTGKFDAASGADDDEAGCMGGGPPFPGHDFTAFHCDGVLDLDSGDFAAVLTIEPEPDNGAGPFQLKPLAGMIPTDALGQNNSLNNQTVATFPTGEARLARVRSFAGRLKSAETLAGSTEESSWGEVKNLFR